MTLLKEGIPWADLKEMSDLEVFFFDIVNQEINKVRQEVAALRAQM